MVMRYFYDKDAKQRGLTLEIGVASRVEGSIEEASHVSL